MIRSLLRRPVAVAMAYAVVALLGVAAWRGLPVELLPDTRLPRLTVTASWPGASPEQTEARLTAPLEAAVQQVHGVRRVGSVSQERFGIGVARVDVEFAHGTDMDFARLDLAEHLAALDEALPPGATRPQLQPYVPEAFAAQARPFLRYTVSGPYTLETLRAYVDDELAPRLARLEGVAAVYADGGRRRLLEIELDEARLLALGLTPERVHRQLAGAALVAEAGVVEQQGRRWALAVRQRPGSAEELRRLPLLHQGGGVVRLADVGVLRDGYEPLRRHYRIDGQPAVSFTVHREIGVNAVAAADRVKRQLAALEAGHPPGVRLILDDDESAAIRAQLNDLRARALVAALVIFVVLLLFLRSLRASAVVFATIALALTLALNALYLGGLTLNVLTLMGLAMGFGLIVDNAIVVLENIHRRRAAGEDAHDAAARGAAEMVLPVLAATLTTLVVLVPFVYLQGELRAYYLPLALAVGLSLLASLLVAFSFIPTLAARLPVRPAAPAPAAADGAPAAGRAGRALRAVVRATLRRPWPVVLGAALLWGGAFYLFEEHVTRGVVWRGWGGDDSYLEIRISLPRGEELARTDALVRHFERQLQGLPEVARFTSRVEPEYGHIRVDMPDSLRHTAAPLLLKERLVALSHRFGGAEVRVYGFGPSFYGGGGSPPNYAIEVLGYNYEAVRGIAEDLARRLTRFSRIQEVDTNASGSWFQDDHATELVLTPDRARLALHGLTAADLVAHVRAATAGAEGRGSLLQLADEEVQYTVKLAGFERMDVPLLERTLLATPAGTAVRLGEVARLHEREVLREVRRENQQYQRRVAYEFRGPVRLGDRVRDAVLEATSVPPGYRVAAGDLWRWSAEERAQVYGVLAVALLLVFMTTAALFESLRLPFVVLLSVPMALVGVFLAFYLTGASFTREAYIGTIMMSGIVVNNAILLVDHVNRLRREAGLALHDALVRGTAERARPILMTSATTVFALLPLVLFSDSADGTIWNALAYSLVGGLVSSTLLVLTVTPALYLLIGDRR